jgi:tetratricopeptide (TPR) repeat protein
MAAALRWERISEPLTDLTDGFSGDDPKNRKPELSVPDQGSDIEALHAALRDDPKDPTRLNRLGIALLNFARTEPRTADLHALEEAQRRFQRASEEAHRQGAPPATYWRFDINRALALWMLGEQNKDKGTLAEAEEILRPILSAFAAGSASALQVQVDWPRALGILANVLVALDQTDEAEEKYRDAIDRIDGKKHPEARHQVLINSGTALYETSHYAKACDRFEQALALTAREQEPLVWAKTQHLLGDALFQHARTVEQPQTAKEHFARAAALYEDVQQEYQNFSMHSSWASATVNRANALLGVAVCLGASIVSSDRQAAIDSANRAIFLLVESSPDLPAEWLTKGQEYLDTAHDILKNLQPGSSTFSYLQRMPLTEDLPSDSTIETVNKNKNIATSLSDLISSWNVSETEAATRVSEALRKRGWSVHLMAPQRDHAPQGLQEQAARVVTRRAKAEAHAQGESHTSGNLDLSPRQVAAVLEDSTLGRLRRRYEERLANVELPKDGFKTKKQAQAAGRLTTTYRDLRSRQLKLGLEPLSKDSRITEADRLREAFYRNDQKRKATPTQRTRSRIATLG